MARIIDFNQKVEERKRIKIIKKENEIEICGWEGEINIHFNTQIDTEVANGKSILEQLMQYIRLKKRSIYSKKQVHEISEEYCKEMFINLMRRISWKGDSSEILIEELWKKLEEEILNSQNFQYTLIRCNEDDCSSPFTLTESYIFIIEKSHR
ncbi:MAG: hypothetical protein IJE05_02425 [Clostridia bacterium]|nr:hypothetical protein [Clostridia bacterium]